jgi:hypothetical protein
MSIGDSVNNNQSVTDFCDDMVCTEPSVAAREDVDAKQILTLAGVIPKLKLLVIPYPEPCILNPVS